MEQPHISYINRIVTLLENILKDMNMPPLDENEQVIINRSRLPEEITITFHREGAATLSIRINESRVSITLGDGLYTTSEESHFIVHNIPDYFEDEISMYLVYPLRIFVTENRREIEARDEEDAIMYQTPYLKQVQSQNPTIYSFKPLFVLSPKQIDEFFVRQQIRNAQQEPNTELAEQIKKKGRISLPVSEIWGYYDSDWWWGTLIVSIMICGLFIPLQYHLTCLGIFLFLFVIFWQSRRWQLKLRKVLITCTPTQLAEAFMETAIMLDWNVDTYTPDYIVAIRTSNEKHITLQERIYILRQENQILIQSIPSPKTTLGYLSTERNKENVTTFLKNLKAAINK